MNFTAKDVAALREKTGCGMMDCKKALTASEGDMEKAIDFLREKGLAASVKKAGRIAAEGMVYATVEGNVGVVLEVNAETDFVAKNEKFVDFVKGVAATVAKEAPADLDALMECKYVGTDLTVTQQQQEMVLVIGGASNEEAEAAAPSTLSVDDMAVLSIDRALEDGLRIKDAIAQVVQEHPLADGSLANRKQVYAAVLKIKG